VLSVVLVVASHYMPKPALGPITALNQRADQLVGRTATVAEDFRNGQGAVTVGDTRWSAQTVDGSDLVAGTRVEIVAAESTLLKVKRV
jgi:membrane protein implicated in regulation of membrane protease activity